MRPVNRSAGRPPSGAILKLRRVRTMRTRRSLTMNARGELFNSPRTNSEAKLKL